MDTPSPSVQYQGDIHPPLSAQVTDLKTASVGKRIITILSTFAIALFIGGIIYGIGYMEDSSWLKWTGIIIGALIGIGGAFMDTKLQVAVCPYCQQEFGETQLLSKKNENLQAECTKCGEWLISHQGKIRSYTQEDAQEETAFPAPVFVEGQWPHECIVCGSAVTRLDKLDTKKINAGMLLVGTASVSSAAIYNIPYCNAHKDAIGLRIKSDFPRLIFSDYAARRRYLAGNKGKKIVEIK
ncbi:MAG TPA: hypothetical protein ENJ82_09255 [Bacteroidetes bacterium]|nr:hypothetical protein [Bacteroidota bacterium]